MAKTRNKFDWSGASYKKYNPDAEGYGNEAEWCRMFNMAMGFEEAQAFRAEQKKRGRWRDEYTILSELSGLRVTENSMWSEIKTAFRKACMNCHPDRMGQHGKSKTVSEDEFKQVSAAYTLVANQRGER